ncbi:hypothetical protein bAD24_p01680 (plasmid) [Burkholderia sp. AD24]|nr:hypothetical protein bAD24_p01680 [Burkholderia sp. AD24]
MIEPDIEHRRAVCQLRQAQQHARVAAPRAVRHAGLALERARSCPRAGPALQGRLQRRLGDQRRAQFGQRGMTRHRHMQQQRLGRGDFVEFQREHAMLAFAVAACGPMPAAGFVKLTTWACTNAV